MKLYTRSGDDGTTGLLGGGRAAKNDPRVNALGAVDETNAAIGVVIAACDEEDTIGWLRQIQSELFVLGSELATPVGTRPTVAIGEDHVTRLERWIDAATAETEPLKQFVLPGGTRIAAGLHLGRTLCRRAERATVALANHEPVGKSALAYLNRLSDLLFSLARRANHRARVADVPWVAPDSAG
jgi:cob(I)alamin adenosyltransferase